VQGHEPDRRASAAAYALLFLLALAYFKTVKAVGVAASVDLEAADWARAYAQDLAVWTLWVGLLAILLRLATGRIAAPLAWGLLSVVHAGLVFYSNFNVHYFSLLGIPLNLEALSDVEQLTDFSTSAAPYFESIHTYVAALIMLVGFAVPWIARGAAPASALRRVWGWLVAGLGFLKGVPVAAAVLTALLFLPIDRHELAKNDIVEMVASVGRIAREQLAEPPPVQDLGGATQAGPDLTSRAHPGEIVERPPAISALHGRLRRAHATRPLNVVFVVLESQVNRAIMERHGIAEAMPYLLSLAEHSLVFDDYSTVFPLSMKSLVTLFCSILPFPPRKTITKVNPRLDCRSFSEVAAEHGYQAGLFHSGRFSFTLKDLFFANRGFDVMYDASNCPNRKEFKRDYWGIEEEGMLRAMFEWVDEQGDRPFAAVYIPVAGHDPFKVFDEKYERFGKASRKQKYMNAMSYVDDMMRQLIGGFEERKLAEDTVFLIMGDHGEGLNIHPNNWIHSAELYEENIQTLAYLYQPRHIRSPIHYPHPVQHIDALPTLYDILGWEVPEQYEGVSIFRPYPRRMAIHYTWRSKRLAALRDGPIKALLNLRNRKAVAFDLAADPEEKVDISAQHKPFIDHGWQFFDAFLPQRTQLIRSYPKKSERPRLPLPIRERLDELQPEAVERTVALREARARLPEGRAVAYAEAEGPLLSVVQADPTDFEALHLLMRLYDRWAFEIDRRVHNVPAGPKDDAVLVSSRALSLHGYAGRLPLSPRQRQRLNATLRWHGQIPWKPAKRIKAWRRARRISRYAPETLAWLGHLFNFTKSRKRLHRKGRSYERELERLTEYVRKHPEDHFVAYRLGRVYTDRLGDAGELRAIYGGRFPYDDTNPLDLAVAGYGAYLAGETRQAADLLEKLVAARRADGNVNGALSASSRLGAVYVLLGRNEEARPLLTAPAEAGQARAAAALGFVELRSGNLAAAKQHLVTARKSRSVSLAWRKALDAEVAAKEGNLARADKLYDRVRNGWPVLVLDSRLRTDLEAGRWTRAAGWLLELVRRTPFCPDRFTRYATIAARVNAALPSAEVPTDVESLKRLNERYYPASRLWGRVGKAKKLRLRRRVARLAREYVQRFPEGTRIEEAKKLATASKVRSKGKAKGKAKAKARAKPKPKP